MCRVYSHLPSHHIGQKTWRTIVYFWEAYPGCAQHTPTAEEPPSKKPMFRSRDHFVAKLPSAIVSIWVFVPSCPDPVWCHRLPLQRFNSKRMRTPPLAGAPWPRISDTVCLSAVIGPVLLSVKMCFWPYGIVFKTPGVQISTEKVGAISDLETSPKIN